MDGLEYWWDPHGGFSRLQKHGINHALEAVVPNQVGPVSLLLCPERRRCNAVSELQIAKKYSEVLFSGARGERDFFCSTSLFQLGTVKAAEYSYIETMNCSEANRHSMAELWTAVMELLSSADVVPKLRGDQAAFSGSRIFEGVQVSPEQALVVLLRGVSSDERDRRDPRGVGRCRTWRRLRTIIVDMMGDVPQHPSEHECEQVLQAISERFPNDRNLPRTARKIAEYVQLFPSYRIAITADDIHQIEKHSGRVCETGDLLLMIEQLAREDEVLGRIAACWFEEQVMDLGRPPQWRISRERVCDELDISQREFNRRLKDVKRWLRDALLEARAIGETTANSGGQL